MLSEKQVKSTMLHSNSAVISSTCSCHLFDSFLASIQCCTKGLPSRMITLMWNEWAQAWSAAFSCVSSLAPAKPSLCTCCQSLLRDIRPPRTAASLGRRSGANFQQVGILLIALIGFCSDTVVQSMPQAVQEY